METEILATDGFTLSINYYLNEDPKAIVQVIHGMSEHKMRYDYFAKSLVSAGYSVVISDMRGHGKSINSKKDLGFFSDKKGHKLLIDDQLTINQALHKKFPDKPIYMFAHSMGTLIARNYIQAYDHTINKLVLSGAPYYVKGVKLASTLSRIITYLSKTRGHNALIQSFANATTSKNQNAPNDWLSYNQENISAYNRDTLCGFPFTNAGYIALYELVYGLHRYKNYQCENPNLDILFLSGVDDPITGGLSGLTDSIDTLKKVGYTHIENKIYPQMKHEILQETEKDQVIADILRFYDNNVDSTNRKE